jgi:hypothetical protein
MARRIRSVLIAIVVLLYIVSVPWYREAKAEPALWFGLPDWVAVALACYLAAAVLNAISWLITDLSEEAPPDEPTGGSASR